VNNLPPEIVKKQDLVFLVGFMGTGKTHWGKIWAEKLHFLFVDLDEVIEANEGISVQEIFENKGENYFRVKEADTLRQMGQKENTIIACGGGTPCFFDNMAWMNATGITVLLDADAGFILQNIRKQLGQRPLLKGMNEEEMLSFIEAKLAERETFYNKAMITLDAQTAGINSIDQLISLK
jgi:shikimate kinase